MARETLPARTSCRCWPGILPAPRRAARSSAERRSRGFGKLYYVVVGWAIDRRLLVFGVSIVIKDLGLIRWDKPAPEPEDTFSP